MPVLNALVDVATVVVEDAPSVASSAMMLHAACASSELPMVEVTVNAVEAFAAMLPPVNVTAEAVTAADHPVADPAVIV